MAQKFFSGPIITETVEPWNMAKLQNGENRIQIYTYPNHWFSYFKDKNNILNKGDEKEFICLRFTMTDLTALEKNGSQTECQVIYGPIWFDEKGISGDTNSPFATNDFFDILNPSDEIYIYCISREDLELLENLLNIPENAFVYSKFLKAILFKNEKVCGGYELYYFIEVLYFNFKDFHLNGKIANREEVNAIVSHLATTSGGTPKPFPIPPVWSTTVACGTRIPNE